MYLTIQRKIVVTHDGSVVSLCISGCERFVMLKSSPEKFLMNVMKGKVRPEHVIPRRCSPFRITTYGSGILTEVSLHAEFSLPLYT
jgi:hypothetical protein